MDILSRLHALPLSRFHYRLLALIGLGWLFDAMDTGMVSFVLVTLAKEWGLSAQQSGWVVSIGFVGMALGAVLSGWAADRFGRRNVFAGTMVLYGAATGLCALSPNLAALLFFRFWVGFGLGGQLPVAVSLVSEYAPPKVRGRFIVLLESFWGLGWLAAALASYFLIPRYGWASAFALGALPLPYALWVRTRLPESVPYLLGRGRVQEAHEIVCRMEAAAFCRTVASALCPPHADAVAGVVRHRLFLLRHFHLAAQAPSRPGAYRRPDLRIHAGADYRPAARLFRRGGAGGKNRPQGNARTVSRRLLAVRVALWRRPVCRCRTGVGRGDVLFNLGAWGVLYTYSVHPYR